MKHFFGPGFFDSFRSMVNDAEKMTSEIEHQFAAGISITNNSGHIVIVGPVKSLRVNDAVIDCKPTPAGAEVRK